MAHFTYLPSKKSNFFENKEMKDYLLKWSMKGQLKATTFSYNEHFPMCHKKNFVETVLKDKSVLNVLNATLPFTIRLETNDVIKVTDLSCTVLSMKFFDRLLDSKYKIVRETGEIYQCLDEDIDGFLITNELKKMFLSEESDNFWLFSEKEKQELVFKLLQLFVLGGKWCQYEDVVKPYLEATKMLYKDLVYVERNADTKKVEINSFVLKVSIENENRKCSVPPECDNIQNFVYLIINPAVRQITFLTHQYGGGFE